MPHVRAMSALLPLLVVLGCTSDAADTGAADTPAPVQPAESEFREGSCRIAAPDVLALGRVAQGLSADASVPAEAEKELADRQTALRTLAEGVEPELAPAFQRLVTAVGFVRIRSVSKTYETALGQEVTAAYEQVVDVCTGPAPAS